MARSGDAALEVTGALGADSGPYAVDTIPLPTANPWRSWIRPTGVDFFRDGRAAIATFSGDVWIASGVDRTLAKVGWRRFAAGLYEPLGLRIVDDVVYVLGRDQITRLVDVDRDGEADSYESFNHDAVVWPTYNNFAFDLQTDQAGNFYYAKGALNTPVGLPLQSVLCRVPKDGRGTTVVATGLRQPNGMGMGPHDELTFSDNEGQWEPASKIVWARQGGWYGYVGDPPHYKKQVPAHPAVQDPPLCWIPMSVDSSSGGQVWAPPGWGPLGGQLLHTSFGKSALMLVLHEDVGGVMQGGVMTLPLKFASGIMRGRVNAADGQVYVCGIKGWQTNAATDGCLQRVRATGRPACLPVAHAPDRGRHRGDVQHAARRERRGRQQRRRVVLELRVERGLRFARVLGRRAQAQGPRPPRRDRRHAVRRQAHADRGGEGDDHVHADGGVAAAAGGGRDARRRRRCLRRRMRWGSEGLRGARREARGARHRTRGSGMRGEGCAWDIAPLRTSPRSGRKKPAQGVGLLITHKSPPWM